MVRLAKVFARPLNKADPGCEVVMDKFGDVRDNAGLDSERLIEDSELYDCDLDVMGIVRLSTF